MRHIENIIFALLLGIITITSFYGSMDAPPEDIYEITEKVAYMKTMNKDLEAQQMLYDFFKSHPTPTNLELIRFKKLLKKHEVSSLTQKIVPPPATGSE